MNKNGKLTVGGVCSGVGGIEYGFKKAGFDILWANDMDKHAMVTYEALHGKNHYIGEAPYTIEQILSDETLLNQLTEVDVLVAGFPCQAFSVAGHRKGFEDERGTVIEDIYKVIEHLNRPKAILLENVKNFRNHDKGKTFLNIKDYLENKLNYSVYDIILNTAVNTSIPQNRERTYIVCFQGESGWDYPDNSLEDESLLSIAPMTFNFHKNIKKIRKYKKRGLDRFINCEALDKDIYNSSHFSKYFGMLEDVYSDSADDNTFYQIRRVYARQNKKQLCPTLTANMGTGGHNVPIIRQKLNGSHIWRRLTPKECFNLQGFPRSFKLPEGNANGQLYKQAGNSISLPLIKILAKNIKNSIF